MSNLGPGPDGQWGVRGRANEECHVPLTDHSAAEWCSPPLWLMWQSPEARWHSVLSKRPYPGTSHTPFLKPKPVCADDPLWLRCWLPTHGPSCSKDRNPDLVDAAAPSLYVPYSMVQTWKAMLVLTLQDFCIAVLSRSRHRWHLWCICGRSLSMYLCGRKTVSTWEGHLVGRHVSVPGLTNTCRDWVVKGAIVECPLTGTSRLSQFKSQNINYMV